MTLPPHKGTPLLPAVRDLASLRALAQQLEGMLLEESERLLRSDPVGTVEALLRLCPSAREMKLNLAADKMCMSIRKLTEILARHGASFTRIRDRVIRERCQKLMDDGVLNAADLADLLGYADPSHFYQVFKRVMGMSFKASLERRKTP